MQLPAEILARIFQQLPWRDLKMVVQVCSFWREVGEAPVLWSRGVVCLARGSQSSLQEVLGRRRMRLARRLRVLDWEHLPEEAVVAVLEHLGLRLLDLRGVALSSADAGLLARLVTGLQGVRLGYSPLAGRQLDAILAGVAGGSGKLRKLKMCFTDLSRVEPGLLALAVAGLEEVDLSSSQLTLQQTQAVLRAAGSSSKLRKVKLAMNDSMSLVRPELLASAVLNLEQFYIGYSDVSSQQIKAIFSALIEATSPKLLKMGYNRLVEFPYERHAIIKDIEKMTNLLSRVKKKFFLSGVDIKLLISAFNLGYYQITNHQERLLINRID